MNKIYCHICGIEVDKDSICIHCEQPVCDNCAVFGDGVTTIIEEIRCKECHENIIDRKRENE